jgi:hypothetical protein
VVAVADRVEPEQLLRVVEEAVGQPVREQLRSQGPQALEVHLAQAQVLQEEVKLDGLIPNILEHANTAEVAGVEPDQMEPSVRHPGILMQLEAERQEVEYQQQMPLIIT